MKLLLGTHDGKQARFFFCILTLISADRSLGTQTPMVPSPHLLNRIYFPIFLKLPVPLRKVRYINRIHLPLLNYFENEGTQAVKFFCPTRGQACGGLKPVFGECGRVTVDTRPGPGKHPTSSYQCQLVSPDIARLRFLCRVRALDFFAKAQACLQIPLVLLTTK